MLQHPLLRTIMAVYLAIWSPVMCCCAVKSGLGRVTGIEVECCAALKSCCTKAAPPLVDEPVHSCCAEPSEQDKLSDPPAHPDGCKCKEKSSQVAPVKQTVSSPSIDFSHSLPTILATITTPVTAASVSIRRDRSCRLTHGPPRDSLFAQHCLLTI